MTPDFWIGLALGLVLASSALLIHVFRRRHSDIWEWSEDAYQPREEQPRAVTRITSNDIEWEVKNDR